MVGHVHQKQYYEARPSMYPAEDPPNVNLGYQPFIDGILKATDPLESGDRFEGKSKPKKVHDFLNQAVKWLGILFGIVMGGAILKKLIENLVKRV